MLLKELLQLPTDSLPKEECTQETLSAVLDEYRKVVRAGRVWLACADWYAKMKELELLYSGSNIDRAMQEWAKKEIAKRSKPKSTVPHLRLVK